MFSEPRLAFRLSCQQQFFGSQYGAVVVAIGWATADGGKASDQGDVGALAPGGRRQACSASRRANEAGRLRPFHGLGCRGSVPGGHRLVDVWIPAT